MSINLTLALCACPEMFSCWCDAPCEACCSSCRLYQNPSRPQERPRLNHLVPKGTWADLWPVQYILMPKVYQHSLVIVPHDHLIRHEGKILKRHGRLVFAGGFFNATLCTGIQPLRNQEEPKPVKLMLRALPLIQAHVRSILAPSVVPE